MLYINTLTISFLQRAPKEGLIPETYWLCSAYDILMTNRSILKYTQEKIKHILLRIRQYREAVPNNSIQRKSSNNEDPASKYLKHPPEPNTRLCSIHLMTIY
jgi:hypothetical protein